ncbi:septal ring factor EnvC (AmiA/AmiB activator) [Dysgonomonas sp. PH5-45]|uniref:murein hydrolase activator EnvC family protein n=1 Tax=unclassified Dysgonomonas TaxID=2630389 RepID=UPI002473E7DE|nr:MULTISPECIES: peptidoglycan DD-metalloendopeptidase family protein [unclassified Dysgonomonas]MDH6355815.1 septal ring factor EnvC (AmiA/AmiB activator) [Dysgonomonas sp. PH5-45]MDH6388718.1 septal ring factor EnvC (AmiA/AmiB activator) [Dysgonomonas sp. PH5-37]
MKYRLFAILLFVCISAFPQTAKIKSLQKQREEMLRAAENSGKLLRDTKKTTNTLLERIRLITTQIAARQTAITLLGQEIEQINNEQEQTQKDIVRLEAELKTKQKSYAKAIDGMLHKRQKENKLLFILSGKSLSESIRRFYFLKDYSEWRNQQADEIKKRKDELASKRAALAKSKASRISLLGLRETEQNNLKAEEKTREKEVSEAKQKEKELQAIINQKNKQANALNAQIERLIAEEVARQEREAKRLAEEKRKAEEKKRLAEQQKNKSKGQGSTPKESASEPTYAKAASPKETQESLKLSSNFASNRGRLPRPLTGSSTIVSHFGTQSRGRVEINNSGIDLQSHAGAEARCVFDGEVTRIMSFPGYNICIIVRHGGYYSFYANVENIYVRQGQKVSTGQSLGKAYVDPDINRSLLHFQLWKGTNKMNPEPWIR